MSDADAGRERVSPEAAAAATREPESPHATRDLQVAAESEPSQPARAADTVKRAAESQRLGGNDGARVAVPEPEARRAVPKTGEAASPYAPSPTPHAQAATPLPSQAEEDAASEERRSRVARVREGTRARVENTRARVERVKDDARVALEDAPDDSGLRFVAVAVVLFVLFLAFLLLSVTILR